MMVTAAELINDNGISAIALAFFTALFAAISTLIGQLYRTRLEFKTGQTTIVERLDNIGNKYDTVDNRLDELETAVRKHLEWHLANGEKNGDQQ